MAVLKWALKESVCARMCVWARARACACQKKGVEHSNEPWGFLKCGIAWLVQNDLVLS